MADRSPAPGAMQLDRNGETGACRNRAGGIDQPKNNLSQQMNDFTRA
jgi:hypothetical protein